LGLKDHAYNNVELHGANYQITDISNVILSTFNFHTQLVHTFDDFIHRYLGNMLLGTNTKLKNQHTLHITPCFLILENFRHGCCNICSIASQNLYLRSKRWSWIQLLLQQNKVKKTKITSKTTKMYLASLCLSLQEYCTT